jgi:SAM-dependent methyltransferase
MTGSPQIFDRPARAQRRDRLARRDTPSPLEAPIADALCERLDSVQRRFTEALIVNTGTGVLAASLRSRGIAVTETDHGPIFAAQRRAREADEDRLSLGADRFDLVIAPCALDTIDDLPGALIAARRMLRPDGLFLAAMPGGPSLPVLRSAMARADSVNGHAVARVHPQVDVRSAGDLLLRAGYRLPVADAEVVRLRYAGVDRLFDDLRATGMTNVLRQRAPVSRRWLADVASFFGAAHEPDGKTVETITFIFMTGWSPAVAAP